MSARVVLAFIQMLISLNTFDLSFRSFCFSLIYLLILYQIQITYINVCLGFSYEISMFINVRSKFLQL